MRICKFICGRRRERREEEKETKGRGEEKIWKEKSVEKQRAEGRMGTKEVIREKEGT